MTDNERQDQQMRDEYDFTGGIRGKYTARFRSGSNVVLLDPDVAAEFTSADEVNEALREQLRGRRASGDG